MGDLGHGVEVRQKGGRVQVLSRQFSMPWYSSGVTGTGTALRFADQIWECRLISESGRGQLWQLEPWPDSEILRHVEELSAERIEEIVQESSRQEKQEGLAFVLFFLMPLTGFLPGVLQEKLEVDYGVPASRATLISALPELACGFLAVQVRTGELSLPMPMGIAFVMLIFLFFEGLFRLCFSIGFDRPLGSVLAFPVVITRRLFSERNDGRKLRRKKNGKSLVVLVFHYSLLGFAPAAVQEEMAPLLGSGKLFFSAFASLAELFGGGLNLLIGASEGVFLLLDLFLVLEGSIRLLILLVMRKPTGSLLGLPLGSLYTKWQREIRADARQNEKEWKIS